MAKADLENTTVAGWLPLQEAIGRAGSFEALRPFLASGHILARAERFYSTAGGPSKHDRDIAPSRWKEARFDPVTCRVYLTLVLMATDTGEVTYEVFAVGIELERAAAEALLPPKAEDKSTKPLEPKQWVLEAADRLRKAPDRPPRKIDAARLIASEMRAAVDAHTCTRPVSLGTIKNLIGPWP